MGKVALAVFIMLAMLVAYVGLAYHYEWLEGHVLQRIVIVGASIYVLVTICSVLLGALNGKYDD